MKVTSRVSGVDIVSVENDGMRRAVQQMNCSKCDAIEQFCNRSGPAFPEEALFKFARQRGWHPHKKGKHVCPSCIKEAAMTKAEAPREMSPSDRREIFREVDGCYDEKNARYVDDYTDNTIAKKLNMPRAWVSKIREENFGPSGENTDMERLNQNLIALNSKLTDAINDAMKAAAKCETMQAEVEKARGQLDKIKTAVGPYRVA